MTRLFMYLCVGAFVCLSYVLPVDAQILSTDLHKQSLPLTDAVVKVFVTSNPVNYYQPWQSKGITAAGGSGTIIGGNRILTNAHVVSDQTFIQVKKDADARKYTARVVAVGHDCDLALLEVDDPSFFKGITPFEFGGLPRLQDSVVVIGYPEGGDKISITEGVVSRLEVTSYAQSSRQLLTVQIDAAINPGNSGGPVVQDGKLVGVAMQIFQAGQNIGYMIPVPVIGHFLNDLGDGKYDGFPVLGIDFKNTENDALRDFYGITQESGGVLIAKILPFSPAFKRLKEGDVVLQIDGVPIGEDGTFLFMGSERLSLAHLVASKRMGDTIRLKVIREKKVKDVSIPLAPFVALIPDAHHFTKPPYYIFGGIVFTVLSTDLIESWGSRWWEKAPLNLIHYAIGTGRLNEKEQKEIVVLLNVLPDDINAGYHDIGNDIVTKVDGRDVKSFKDFVLTLNDVKNKQRYTVIQTEYKSHIILNNADIEQANQKILRRNNIPQQYSGDVGLWLGDSSAED